MHASLYESATFPLFHQVDTAESLEHLIHGPYGLVFSSRSTHPITPSAWAVDRGALNGKDLPESRPDCDLLFASNNEDILQIFEVSNYFVNNHSKTILSRALNLQLNDERSERPLWAIAEAYQEIAVAWHLSVI